MVDGAIPVEAKRRGASLPDNIVVIFFIYKLCGTKNGKFNIGGVREVNSIIIVLYLKMRRK